VYWIKSDPWQMTKYTLHDGRCDRYIGEVLFTSLGRCGNGGMVHNPRWITKLYVHVPNETLSSRTSFLTLCFVFPPYLWLVDHFMAIIFFDSSWTWLTFVHVCRRLVGLGGGWGIYLG
jgi:hypothetical protein